VGFIGKKFGKALTDVVLTPQSNSGRDGEGAGGVSTQSYWSSLSEGDILTFRVRNLGVGRKGEGEGCGNAGAK
jgi:hypothetical protein